ncbi:hypothetical protein HPB49_009297 [Dermacentor silvarum]|uniref:Uncharacterized protein n=1 Tax=Dermacentor silvarum TaxID=543639 RepID=A0ACB8CE58_DERSI|nr:hypothetical protein HPB49_009297 [Dermacentor silvarum]
MHAVGERRRFRKGSSLTSSSTTRIQTLPRLKAPVFDDVNKEEPMDGELFITSNSNVSWRQGRQLLRQYLQEIGYTDTILDVRSARVRTLLGLGPAANAGSGNAPDDKAAHPAVNGGSAGGTAPGEHVKRSSDTQRRVPGKKMVNVAENALLDTEASVLATFDFLATETVDMRTTKTILGELSTAPEDGGGISSMPSCVTEYFED